MVNILVVLYKKRLSESITLTNLSKIKKTFFFGDSQLIIWDNSPEEMDQNDLSLLGKSMNINYVHTPQNLPLSKIYNSVIETYMASEDYLILLDHDTDVTEAYFAEIAEKISEPHPPNLLLPQIFVNDIIQSPAYQHILYSKKWDRLKGGLYKSKKIGAINSGMVISGRFFSDGFRYDERLLFYGTDTYMTYLYGHAYKEFYLLNASLKHNLNFLSNSSIAEKAKVFKEIKRGNLIVYSANIIDNVLARLNNFIISIKYSVKYRSILFFKC
jgi:hypothetical protein